MITGVYPPEINGAVLQCEELMSALAREVDFEVLTGTHKRELTGRQTIGKIQITRIYQSKSNLLSKAIEALNFLFKFVQILRGVDLVHVHGFSPRNSLVMLLARGMNKPVVLKMSSYGQDDPVSVKKRSKLLWFLYKLAGAFIAISPAFVEACKAEGLQRSKCHFIPNGVNTKKFCPGESSEKSKLKSDYGLKDAGLIFLFVGHFSKEKRPEFLYNVWAKIVEGGRNSTLVFIGKTTDGYEVDADLSRKVMADSRLRGLETKIIMIDQTNAIADYMKMADIFVHPSIREGLPNVVLESMASALPCVVTNLPGVTDWIIDEGQTGILFPQDDEAALRESLEFLLRDEAGRKRLGSNARQYALENHGFERVAELTMEVYGSLSRRGSSNHSV
jgi:glycosyltransferase involved in cell wall biosynthesis